MPAGARGKVDVSQGSRGWTYVHRRRYFLARIVIAPVGHPRRTSLLFAGTVAVLLLGLWVSGLGWYRDVLIDRTRAEGREIVARSAARLSGLILENNARLEAVEAFLAPEASVEVLDTEFRAFARGLIEGRREVRNLSVAPEGVQRYVYPPAEAAGLIGHDLLADPRPSVRAAARRALETGETVTSGPYPLRQGGHGFVLRRGVRERERAWGLVAIVLDTRRLLENAGLSPRMDGFEIGVRRQGGDEPFFGTEEAFAPEAVTGTVRAVDSVWEVGARPLGGFAGAIGPQFDIVKWLSFSIVVLLVLLAYTLRARIETTLDTERRLLKRISDTSPVGIILLDRLGQLTFANPLARQILGLDEVTGGRYDNILWETTDLDGNPVPPEELPFARVMRTGETVADARHRIFAGDEERSVSINAAPFRDGVVAIIQDVTKQVESERHIRAALHEKEVLLREIHHRVKNNLTIITSLLSLQQSRIRSAEEAGAAFAETQNRVQALAQLHRMLYQSENLEVIDLADYLTDAARRLQSAYDAYGRVQVVFNLHTVEVDMDRAIPAGLVFTELFTNALKHGVPASGGGRIWVTLTRDADGGAVIEVADNGAGMSASAEAGSGGSLGMELVHALTQQLQGELDVRRNGGTTFRLRFSVAGR